MSAAGNATSMRILTALVVLAAALVDDICEVCVAVGMCACVCGFKESLYELTCARESACACVCACVCVCV